MRQAKKEVKEIKDLGEAIQKLDSLGTKSTPPDAQERAEKARTLKKCIQYIHDETRLDPDSFRTCYFERELGGKELLE
jgi:hypothetical protein